MFLNRIFIDLFLLEFFRFLELAEFCALEAFALNSLSNNFSLILFKSFYDKRYSRYQTDIKNQLQLQVS